RQIVVRGTAFCAAWLLRIWFATCRVTVHGWDFRRTVEEKNKAVIAIFWHYSLLYIFYHLRKVPAAVLVSASEDGDYIAALATNLKFKTVRGSRNRRGLRALKDLISCLEHGEHIGIVADGSQGPPLVVQPGAILMASRTGSPILPLSWSSSRYVTFHSWDRTVLPLPFSQVHLCYGEPVYIPSGISSDELELYRGQLEEQMKALYRQAWSHFDKENH
ncbi:MAG: lysophospholipid acyltransferase family protein, partial [Desulfocapsaceae bacterium]|nr:lysophospholipid acyltransferase family protein [Desulfocapsaceae bacterium]